MDEKETRDFVEFWAPYMKEAPYYFITFYGNRDMDRLAPLVISPKPDTVIRVFMDFAPLKKPIVVDPLPISTPKRTGFTVVEWGGRKK